MLMLTSRRGRQRDKNVSCSLSEAVCFWALFRQGPNGDKTQPAGLGRA